MSRREALGSTLYFSLICLATSPDTMMATVLFAVAQSTRETREAMPSCAVFGPLIMP